MERQYPNLPGGYKLILELTTVDLDVGNPEVGPRPDLQVVPISVGIRNSKGEPIATGMLHQDHEYRLGPTGSSLYDQVNRWMNVWDVENRDALIGYLHEEGLV